MASTLIVDQIQKTGGSTTALTLPTSNASADEFLQNDGAGALSWASAGGGFLGLVSFESSGDYTPGTSGHADVSKIIVEVQASGGGSGGIDGVGYVGGSGGGGAYALKFLDIGTDRSVITKCTVTVGAASSATPVAAGNTSSFAKASSGGGSGSFTTITCAGGSGGSSGSGAQGSGGAGAAKPTTGDINYAGGSGAHGGANFLTAIGGWSKLGGYNMHSNPTGSHAPTANVGYGRGASVGTGLSQSGGASGPGIVLVWEYK